MYRQTILNQMNILDNLNLSKKKEKVFYYVIRLDHVTYLTADKCFEIYQPHDTECHVTTSK